MKRLKVYVSEAYLEPSQTLAMKHFSENSLLMKAVNFFRKNASS